ncbi:MAG: polysaccharide pyruvyl transferase family protein, partial [Endomicrobium sp.]|nr:polysaccharide pyruvyl transferase family protein [Endomicrobium sp.]
YLFSSRNEGTHKVIRLFGVKLSFRLKRLEFEQQLKLLQQQTNIIETKANNMIGQYQLYQEVIKARSTIGQNNIFILCVHAYDNIGDLSIGLSEYAFLIKYFPNYNIHQFSMVALAQYWTIVKAIIQKDDLIVIHGGGNMGDIWLQEEVARRKVISTFTDNHIISFPQSVQFYNETELEKSKAIYCGHKKLLLTARDDTSYNRMKEYFFNNKVIRTEDIVFSSEYGYYAYEEDLNKNPLILFILRSDREKSINSETIAHIKKLFAKNVDIDYTDMINGTFFENTGFLHASAVYNKLNEIYRASLVITDRLHAAIFAILTGTPVIVFDNSYNKISGALKNIVEYGEDKYVVFLDKDSVTSLTKEDIDRLIRHNRRLIKPHKVFHDTFELYAKEMKEFIKIPPPT